MNWAGRYVISVNHSPKPRKLLEQARDVIRLKHYSCRTEQTYVAWIRRYILFHGKRHPVEMGVPEVEAFLTDLAVQGRVSASTQNQALSALLFLYRHVLKIGLDERIELLDNASVQDSGVSLSPR